MILTLGAPESRLNLPNGQIPQLKLHLSHLSLHVLIREAKVDAGRIDIPVSQLFLQGIQAATTVQEVNGVAMAEEVGMHRPMQIGPVGSLSCPAVSKNQNRRPLGVSGAEFCICFWSHRSDLNRRPAVYETAALPLSYGGS